MHLKQNAEKPQIKPYCKISILRTNICNKCIPSPNYEWEYQQINYDCCVTCPFISKVLNCFLIMLCYHFGCLWEKNATKCSAQHNYELRYNLYDSKLCACSCPIVREYTQYY